MKIVNYSNLIRVYFNLTMGDHITQKFARAEAKRTLISIKVQFVFPQYLKNTLKVIYMQWWSKDFSLEGEKLKKTILKVKLM